MWSSMPDERLPLAVPCRGESWLDVACSPMRTSAVPGKRRRRRCSPCSRALELGVTGIELDVHATADRHLVVCHDGTVDRTTNSHGPIHSMTLAELPIARQCVLVRRPVATKPRVSHPESYPYRGRAPASRSSAWPRWPRCSTSSTTTPGSRSISTSSRRRPPCEPYEELLADELAAPTAGPTGSSWRRSSTPDGRLREVRARHRHLGGNIRHRGVLAGRARGRRAPGHGTRAPSGVRPPKETSSS